jgi:hypothetical protein
VFLSSQGTHLRRSNFNRRVWQPATRAAGVEGLRMHDLRHTAGTPGHRRRRLLARGDGPAGALDHRGRRALPARHGRPGRRHRPGAEPTDRGRLSAAMARRWHAGPRAPLCRWNRPGVGPGLTCGFVVEPPPESNRRPILTMDRRPSAVLAGVSAAQTTPKVPRLWGRFRASKAYCPDGTRPASNRGYGAVRKVKPA